LRRGLSPRTQPRRDEVVAECNTTTSNSRQANSPNNSKAPLFFAQEPPAQCASLVTPYRVRLRRIKYVADLRTGVQLPPVSTKLVLRLYPAPFKSTVLCVSLQPVSHTIRHHEKNSTQHILTSSVKTVPRMPPSRGAAGNGIAGHQLYRRRGYRTSPAGIFTERDAVHLWPNDADWTPLKYCRRDDVHRPSHLFDIDFREAYRLLQERGFRHLVIIDKQALYCWDSHRRRLPESLDSGDLSEFKSAEKVMSPSIITVDVVTPLRTRSADEQEPLQLRGSHPRRGTLRHTHRTRCGETGCRHTAIADTPVAAWCAHRLITIREHIATGCDQPHGSAQDPPPCGHRGRQATGLLTRHDLVKTLQGSLRQLPARNHPSYNAKNCSSSASSETCFKLHDARWRQPPTPAYHRQPGGNPMGQPGFST